MHGTVGCCNTMQCFEDFFFSEIRPRQSSIARTMLSILAAGSIFFPGLFLLSKRCLKHVPGLKWSEADAVIVSARYTLFVVYAQRLHVLVVGNIVCFFLVQITTGYTNTSDILHIRHLSKVMFTHILYFVIMLVD